MITINCPNRFVEYAIPTLPKVAKDVPPQSSLESTLQFLRPNYYNCLSLHEDDCYLAPAFLPRRVVDISESQWRLVETNSSIRGRYATLSYSWGDRGFPITTFDSYQSLKRGFDAAMMPIAFQDAADITRGLKIRYLWIDTLCIIQDSPSDWDNQAARMGYIFEHAAITIAASFSRTPFESLFTDRDSKHEEIELYSDPRYGVIDGVFKARKKIDRGFHAKIGRSTHLDHLDTRAWGLQEKALSTRLLAFTASELQWSCKTSKICECHENSYPSKPLLPESIERPTGPDDMRRPKIWSQIIEEYSARNLTIADDKLPAIAGLASKFNTLTNLNYHAGLWLEDLLYGLVWQHDTSQARRSSVWLAPTYSWASVNGPVNFRFARHAYPGARIQHSKVIESDYKSASENKFGKASGCRLTLQGHSMTAFLRRSTESKQDWELCIDGMAYQSNTDRRAACEFSVDRDVNLQENRGLLAAEEEPSHELRSHPPKTESEEEKTVMLLYLYSIHHPNYLYQNFLILQKSQDQPEEFERVGVGSGKMYRGSDENRKIPNEPQCIRPFEWHLSYFENTESDLGSPVDKIVCIR